MRASRAYIAGFGTTSVLVASALLLLAVVSTLVAFQGWPGTGLTENIGSLKVDEPGRLTVDGPVQVALNASSAVAGVADSPAPGTAAAAASRVTVTRSPDLSSLPTVVGPTTGGPQGGANLRDEPANPAPEPTGEPTADEPGGGLLPETALSPQVNRLTQGLGDTTQGLTDNLGNTVGRLNPQLGQTLTGTGRMLAELLRSLGRPAR